MPDQMTQEEYIKEGAVRCPYCRSKDVAWESLEGNPSGTAVCESGWCHGCRKGWWVNYQIKGYEGR